MISSGEDHFHKFVLDFQTNGGFHQWWCPNSWIHHGQIHLQMDENWENLHDFGNLRMATSSEKTCPIPSLAESPTWQRPSGMTWCRHPPLGGRKVEKVSAPPRAEVHGRCCRQYWWLSMDMWLWTSNIWDFWWFMIHKSCHLDNEHDDKRLDLGVPFLSTNTNA